MCTECKIISDVSEEFVKEVFMNVSRYFKISIIIAVFMTIMCLSSCGVASHGKAGDDMPTSEGALEIHYLDVGQADATLLMSGGEAVMIDAGNRDDDSFIVNYINGMGIEQLKYMVFTHPHEDHIGSGEAIINNFGVDKIYMLDEYDEGVEGYLKRNIESKGIQIERPVPGSMTVFGECEIEFLGPYSDYDNANDDSICLRVIHGNNSIMFTGDAGNRSEREVIENSGDIRADILQAGHHGSSRSNSYYFLREVNPKYVVISCGVDNIYGHPHDEALSRFNDLGAEVFRTDEQGTVIAVSDGDNITFNCEGKKSDRQYNEDYEEAEYIGNINSKKYHLPECGGLPKENNRVYFMSREQAEKLGYEPCGNCIP